MTNRSLELAVLAVVFLVLAAIVVSLRCYVRIKLKHCFWADDILCLISLLVFLAGIICLLIGVQGGIFGHDWMSLTPDALEEGLKLLWIFELSYIASTALVKLSICLFLYRYSIYLLHKWIIYIVFGVLCVFNVFLFFFALFQCHPVRAFWENPFNEGGACNRVGTTRVTFAHSVIVSLSDWTLGILPILIVWKMNLGFRTKLYIAIILALGSVASVATLARFAYVHWLIDPKNLFYHTGLIIWSFLEVAIALTASSLATLRPLLVQLGSYVSHYGRSHILEDQLNHSTENTYRPSQHRHTGGSDIELGNDTGSS